MSMELADRSAFVGANVRPIVKEILQGEVAPAMDISVSKWVSDLVEEKLKAMGYDLTAGSKPPYRGEPLPFGEHVQIPVPDASGGTTMVCLADCPACEAERR